MPCQERASLSPLRIGHPFCILSNKGLCFWLRRCRSLGRCSVVLYHLCTMRRVLSASLLLVLAASAFAYRNEVVRPPQHDRPRSVRPGSMPMGQFFRVGDLPTAWDWRSVNGTNYLTKSLNQHIPVYCGACALGPSAYPRARALTDDATVRLCRANLLRRSFALAAGAIPAVAVRGVQAAAGLTVRGAMASLRQRVASLTRSRDAIALCVAGSMSALADRIKILRRAAWPDVNLAIQVILNCGTNVAGSCHGGMDTGAYQYVQDNGIPDDTCQLYEAVDNSCSAINVYVGTAHCAATPSR